MIYLSRKLLPQEKRYTVGELECLAIVWGLNKLRPYLLGVKFALQTDHHPLVFINQSKKKSEDFEVDLAVGGF